MVVNKYPTNDEINNFITSMDIPENIKQELLNVTIYDTCRTVPFKTY